MFSPLHRLAGRSDEHFKDNTPWVRVRDSGFNGEFVNELVGVILVGVLLTSLMVGVILVTGWFSIQPEVGLGDLLTVASIVVALAIGLSGYTNGRITAKRSHTIDLLSQVISNEGLRESFAHVRGLDAEEVAEKYANEELSDEDYKHLANVFNYFELIANSCDVGDVDRDVVLKLRGEVMSSKRAEYREFIGLLREKSNSEAMKSFTNLVAEYDGRKATYLSRPKA